MVESLSPRDQEQLNGVLKNAARTTTARIKVIVLNRSDFYYGYILTYGLILGSLISCLLWDLGLVTFFPWSLAVQLGTIALCDLVHGLSLIVIRLVPQKVRYDRASHMAMHQYHALHAHTEKEVPFILLFVSLAERYVHIVTNPVVHQQIPGEWEQITEAFTKTIRKNGATLACCEAVGRMGAILSVVFPAKS